MYALFSEATRRFNVPVAVAVQEMFRLPQTSHRTHGDAGSPNPLLANEYTNCGVSEASSSTGILGNTPSLVKPPSAIV